ncbi:ribonuclease HI family protein [Geomicrobium sp. JCM 19039]|uniref:ribonuclease HI family protein n=1 Tax=Geomicrobium sp. JCM 19039 TaxID=1460636 RepID=UPI000693AC0E|nr:ribonuclease HI family protein [Geomicrobium sp. JCM 19039]
MSNDEVVHVYVDAACAGDPGKCGLGVFLKHPSGDVERFSIPSHLTHIHAAEFVALKAGMDLAASRGYTHARFFTDSQLVDQSVHDGKVKNQVYKPYLHDVLLLSIEFRLFIVSWISNARNKEADHLAKQAIHKQLET